MSGGGFAFGPYQLASPSRQLRRNGEPVALTPLQAALLHDLVSARGNVVSKQRLVEVGWGVNAISDSSLEKQFSQLRSILDRHNRKRYIVNFARQGYRVAEPITDIVPEVDIAATLAPYRAYVEGRALLEACERDSIEPARMRFEDLLRLNPNDALAHVGLANACVMLFESTRATLSPDRDALKKAHYHSDMACKLAPTYAEAWATHGFILERVGDRHGAVSALWRAVRLEPGNWLHWLRLAYGTWGQERLRAIHELLKLVPGLPAGLAMKAQVFIARCAPDLAHVDVTEGVEEMAGGTIAPPVAPLHWLDGLLCMAQGRKEDGRSAFDRELALESLGHLYAREVCAQVWYAKGADRYLEGEYPAAQAAYAEVFTRVPHHPLAHAGMFLIARRHGRVPPGTTLDDLEIWKRSAVPVGAPGWFEREMAAAVVLVDDGKHSEAAQLLHTALGAAPPGNSGWHIPLDLLLQVQKNKPAWRHTLARLHTRARQLTKPVTPESSLAQDAIA